MRTVRRRHGPRVAETESEVVVERERAIGEERDRREEKEIKGE